MHEAFGLPTFLPLHPRLRMHISHPIFCKVLGRLVEIAHDFSLIRLFFQSSPTLHSSVQTCFCVPVQSAVLVLCRERLTALQERTIENSLPWWTGMQLYSCTVLHHSRISLCNSHVAQAVIKTRHRTMQLNGHVENNACSSDKYCRE